MSTPQRTGGEVVLSAEERAEAEAIHARISGVMRANAQRKGWEFVSDTTPADEFLAAELGMTAESEIPPEAQGVRATFRWLFSGPSGHDPRDVMRRLYSIVQKLDPGLTANMPYGDLAAILGETKANFSYRTLRLFPRMRGRAQKREGARKIYAEKARGNNSRRKGERWKKQNKRRKHHVGDKGNG